MIYRSKCVFEPLEARQMFASGLLADINTSTPTAGGLTPIGVVGDRVVCAIYSPGSYRDGLWATDGTPAGTLQLTADRAQDPTLSGGRVYYIDAQTTLWSTDGTPGGTRPVTALPGATTEGLSGDSADVRYDLLDVNGVLYVGGKDGLWRSDGTAAGTVRLLRAEGVPFAGVEGLFQRNSDVFFKLSTGQGGLTSVWRSDGTVAGTVLLATVTPDSSFVRHGRNVYFLADDALWRTGGTRGSTTRVRTFLPGELNIFSNGLGAGGGKIFFTTTSVEPGADRTDQIPDVHLYLWSSDGTAGGTTVITDFGTDAGRPHGIATFAPFSGGVLFPILFGSSTSLLFRSDGTKAGTVDIKSFESSIVGGGITAGKSIYFTTTNPALSGSLWKSDGTPAGTQRVVSLSQYITRPVVFGNAFYFGGGDFDLYRSDGTTAGTVALDIPAAQFASSNPTALFGAGTTRFFFADDGVHGSGVWHTDGTSAGTKYLAAAYSNGGRVRSGVMLNGVTYAIASSGLDGTPGLIKLTSTGLSVVKSVPGLTGHDPLVAAGGRMYFTVPTGMPNTLSAHQLWTSDGTAAGTRPVEGINFVNREMHGLFTLGGRAYFTASHKGNVALWTTDGTTAGTRRVRDVGTRQLLTPAFTLGNIGYFNISYGDAPRTLWRTDGTTAGTRPVRDGTLMVSAARLGTSGHTIVFGDHDGLWRTDGTAAGTVRLIEFGSLPQQMTAVGSRVYFTIAARRRGTELWVTDGTADSTRLVKDIRTGPSGSDPVALTAFKGRLYFTASDGVNGRELWASDGTTAGTKIAAEVQTGAPDSNIENLSVFGNRLIFAGTSNSVGRELFYFE